MRAKFKARGTAVREVTLGLCPPHQLSGGLIHMGRGPVGGWTEVWGSRAGSTEELGRTLTRVLKEGHCADETDDS